MCCVVGGSYGLPWNCLDMGNLPSSIDAALHADVAPDYKNPSKFDPLTGFQNGRKERVMVATQEEMDAARLPLEKRDYCAHLYLDWLRCRDNVDPWFGYFTKCKHLKHVYENCQFDDFVLRMKEYEREKRLLKREKRIGAKQSKEDLIA